MLMSQSITIDNKLVQVDDLLLPWFVIHSPLIVGGWLSKSKGV